MRTFLARRWTWLALVVFLGVVALTWPPPPATADHPFVSPDPPMISLEPTAPIGSNVQAIISTGDTYHGFLFEGIPDGIGLAPGDTASTVNVFVSHEQTTIPFFGTRDFQGGSVSKLTLRTSDGAVVAASVALPPNEGFLRFCSASMAGPDEGFRRYTFFTGEEANDIVAVPPGALFGPDPSIAPQRQAGFAVALDVESGDYVHVPGMGRFNHENTIALPGYSRRVLLSTDDTFSSPGAQLYMYIASRESHIWRDKGSLWAFRVTRTQDGPIDSGDPSNDANDYLDMQAGDDWQGEFIRVPREIALGETGQAPQTALENWSNEENVFQFIRLEDLAYDKNNPRVVFVADSGNTRIVPDFDTGRMQRGPGGTQGFADNGRIFKFVMNKANPRKVDSFSVLADGDSSGADFVPFRHPDNLGTSENSLMVQEDDDEAKIWRYDLATGSWTIIASVIDPDGESSGIVDASNWFGPGSWLLDVQGHGSNVNEEVIGGITFKRETGQLLLMSIPGS